MRIYLVAATVATGYDEYRGFVVVAESSRRAREYAQAGAPAQPKFFSDPKKSSCESIGEANARQKPGIVLEDFQAGS